MSDHDDDPLDHGPDRPRYSGGYGEPDDPRLDVQREADRVTRDADRRIKAARYTACAWLVEHVLAKLDADQWEDVLGRLSDDEHHELPQRLHDAGVELPGDDAA